MTKKKKTQTKKITHHSVSSTISVQIPALHCEQVSLLLYLVVVELSLRSKCKRSSTVVVIDLVQLSSGQIEQERPKLTHHIHEKIGLKHAGSNVCDSF